VIPVYSPRVCEYVISSRWVRVFGMKEGFLVLQSEGFFVEAVVVFDLVQSLFFERSLDPMQNVVYVVLFRSEGSVQPLVSFCYFLWVLKRLPPRSESRREVEAPVLLGD